MTQFTRIKRTIYTLQDCYPCQKIDKELIKKCLNNKDFQVKYINY